VSIRLLIADDQALVRGALAALLDLEPDLEVVSEVGRGDEIVDAVLAAKPDVALLDVEMPGLDGIAATAALRAALPGCRVLVVTTFGRPGYRRTGCARFDGDDLWAARVPASRDGGGGCRVRREGHACRATRRRRTTCAPRAARG
jgi:CheY-like chemotaxis protein